MKKFFLAVSVLLSTVLTVAANPGKSENPRAEQAFKKMFADASHVKWEKTKEGYTQVTFVWGDHRVIAFFDAQAELIGTIRGLLFKELPLSVAKAVTDQVKSPIVLEVNEIFNSEGINYTLLIEQKDKTYRIRLNSLGYILEKEKIKK